MLSPHGIFQVKNVNYLKIFVCVGGGANYAFLRGFLNFFFAFICEAKYIFCRSMNNSGKLHLTPEWTFPC